MVCPELPEIMSGVVVSLQLIGDDICQRGPTFVIGVRVVTSKHKTPRGVSGRCERAGEEG
jgi:hypothetical protein